MYKKALGVRDHRDIKVASTIPEYNTIHVVFFDIKEVTSDDSSADKDQGCKLVNIFDASEESNCKRCVLTQVDKAIQLVTTLFSDLSNIPDTIQTFNDLVLPRNVPNMMGDTKLGIIDGVHRCAAMLEVLQEENLSFDVLSDVCLYVPKLQDIDNNKKLFSNLRLKSSSIMTGLTSGCDHSLVDAVTNCLREVKNENKFILDMHPTEVDTFLISPSKQEGIVTTMTEHIARFHALCMQTQAYRDVHNPKVIFAKGICVELAQGCWH